MIVNNFDKELSTLLKDPEEILLDFDKLRELMEGLCDELKQFWHGNPTTDDLVKELIDDCLNWVTPNTLEDFIWDETKADSLLVLFLEAESVMGLRNAIRWASYSRKPEIRTIVRQLEFLKSSFFLNESLESLLGMAFDILRWLAARNTLILEYRKR